VPMNFWSRLKDLTPIQTIMILNGVMIAFILFCVLVMIL
jgi:hypothetical protein